MLRRTTISANFTRTARTRFASPWFPGPFGFYILEYPRRRIPGVSPELDKFAQLVFLVEYLINVMFQAIHALDVHTSMYVVHHRFPLRIHNVLRWYTRLGDGYVWALVVAYLFWNYPFFAFPSGHTMNNLAAGLTIAILAPEIGWLVVFMPITWGVLRIYFGVHWLSDVIAEVWLHLLTNTFGIV